MANTDKISLRHLGHISLALAAAGMIVLEAAIRLGYLQSPWWRVLATGFEAATAGALADWFAVSALFREVPIPVLRRHTNILLRNRQQMTAAIADLVQHQWFTPEALGRLLSQFSASQKILTYLEDEAGRARGVQFILRELAPHIDDPRVSRVIQEQLRSLLGRKDLSMSLGKWLDVAIAHGYDEKLWHWILRATQRILDNPDLRNVIIERLKRIGLRYKSEGFWKGFAMYMAEKTGGLDYDRVASLLIDEVSDFASTVAASRQHPMRQEFDAQVRQFVQGLQDGDEKCVRIVREVQEALVENEGTVRLLEELLTHLKNGALQQAQDPQGKLVTWLADAVRLRVDKLRRDPQLRERMDLWVRHRLEEWVKPAQIGKVVQEHLGKLSDVELVRQIESKVGDELQYIRLNGAIVGGMVGLVIGLVRFIVFPVA